MLVASLSGGRVIEAPVDPLCLAWKRRAGFIRVIADRNDVVELLVDEFLDGLRLMIRYVDPDFAHHRDCFRSKLGGRNPRTVYFESFTGNMSQNSFRHLTTSGVSGAQNKDSLSVVHIVLGTSQLNRNVASVAPTN